MPEGLVVVRRKQVVVQHLDDVGEEFVAVPDDAALVLGQPRVQELQALFVRVGVLDDLVAFEDDPARVFAAGYVVQAQEHVGGVLDDVQVAQHLAGHGVDHFLRFHGQRAVLPYVVGIELVLAVGDAQDDHPPFRVQEVARLVDGAQGFFLVGVHADQGQLFHAGVGAGIALADHGGDGAVRLAQHADHEPFAHLVQPPREQRAGGAPLGHDGKAVQLHQILVHEQAVALVHLVVAHVELADAHAEALDFAVEFGRERGVHPAKVEMAKAVQGEDLRAVHGQQKGHQGGVVVEHGGVEPPEALAERFLKGLGQAGLHGLHVAGDDLRFQRARGPFRNAGRIQHRVQDVELEDFLKVVEGTFEGHHAEAGQLLVFPQVSLERGQQFARFDQRVVGMLEKGAQQALLDVHHVEKALQFGKRGKLHRLGQQPVFAVGEFALAEGVFQGDLHAWFRYARAFAIPLRHGEPDCSCPIAMLEPIFFSKKILP